VEAIAPMGLAYLHVALENVAFDYHSMFRPLFPGSYLYGSGLTKEKADGLLESGAADAAVFGALFVANPDLPRRFALNAPLESPDPNTLYGGAAQGYIDYPSLEAS
jgi:N-ethylmaleimide reductase